MLAAGSGVVALVLSVLAARRFTQSSWPLSYGHPGLLAAGGLLLLIAFVLKVQAWQRLFASDERPRAMALAAANGGASVMALALPGRFDDALRIAIVRRYAGCPAGVASICLSLFMLGLIDTAALAPLALAAAALSGSTLGLRAALAILGGAGIGASVLIVGLPHVAATSRVLRSRVGRWLKPRTTSLRDASRAWLLVSGYWLARTVALVLLLGTLGVGFSFPLAVIFLCAGAAAGAIPIGPAGAATQTGAGAAVLIASGIGAPHAVGAALAIQALGILCGAAVFVFAAGWRTWLRRSARLAIRPTAAA